MSPERFAPGEARDANGGAPAILVESLVKRYDGRDVVDGVDLVVAPGEVFGLLGRNGAGKTTTVETIAGLRKPTSGRVAVFGLDPATQRDRVTRLLAIQPQAASLFPTLTALETLELFAAIYDDPVAPAEIVAELGLADAAATRVSRLSGGQARRLLLGVALVGRPRAVILDEPSAGLDPASRRALWATISTLRERGVAVLLTTHHMDEATELCDRIAVMARGRVAALGSPERLIRDHASRATVHFELGSETDLERLGALADLARFEVRRGSAGFEVSAETADPDALLRRITFAPGLRPARIGVRRGSLEDVFLGLTEGEAAP